MKWIAFGLVGLLFAGVAHAQSSQSPIFQRRQQGADVAVTNVTCDTTTAALLAADHSRRAVMFQNIGGTNPVYVCGAATCTTATGWRLLATAPGEVVSFEFAAREAFSCITTGGSTVVQIGVQK